MHITQQQVTYNTHTRNILHNYVPAEDFARSASWLFSSPCATWRKLIGELITTSSLEPKQKFHVIGGEGGHNIFMLLERKGI